MSKLKYGGGERRVTSVTCQMTAIQLPSPNPLRIPEMLENILGFLPVEDLKRCRFVNKFWKDTALKPMRKKCAKITFGLRTRAKYGLEGMEKFLQCFSTDPAYRDSGLLSVSSDPEIQNDILCTKFEIYTGIIHERKSQRDELIVANFLQEISPWVTEFTLKGGKDIGRLLTGVEDLKFPSLKHIVFSKEGYETEDFVPSDFISRMSVFVTNSPQLKKLELISVCGLLHQDQDPSFFQFLLQNKGLRIKELRIDSGIENNDLLVLNESDLKLKSLTLEMQYTFDLSQLPQLQISKVPMSTLPQLLKQQSEDLESFSISGFYGATESVPFPIMKQLKAMYGTYPGFINYAKQTPSLEIIHKSAWWMFSNGEMEPAPSVKEVCFRCPPTTAEEIHGVFRIFPNISKLEIPAHAVYVPIVYNSLPNLEELTLNTVGSIDVLLTGLTYGGHKHAVRRLEKWTHDFDESDIQIGIRHSPISVLTNLKLLRLRTANHEPGCLEVTAVSLCLVLMKMPSLQILDLCERCEAPDKVIPEAVLKEFRKDRLILWKPRPGGKPFCQFEVCELD